MNQTTRIWVNILFFFLTYFCVEIIIQGIYIIISDIPIEGDLTLTESEFLITTVLSAIIASVVVYFFVKQNDASKPLRVGLTAQHKVRDFALGTALGALVMAFGFGSLLALGEIQVKNISFDAVDLACSTIGFLAVAYGEELVFRGFLIRKLQLKYSAITALIVSSIIFTIMHLANDNLSLMGVFDLFIAGIMLGAIFLYTKNLWMVIGLHFSWNFVQSHLGFNVSGLDSYSIVETQYAEQNLLNGGAFGFEGSILSTLAQLVILITLYFLFRKQSNTQFITAKV
ncbi:MAG: lysostaphin resistance A-like protein [Psychrobium sp.]